MDSESDLDLVKVVLMDDGDWEYNRMGVGENEGRVFIVDLDDSGEEEREMEYVKEGLSVEDVLKIGVECGVINEIDWGYDEDDKFRVNWESGEEDWDNYRKKIK